MQIIETVLVKVPQTILSYSFGSLGNLMLWVFWFNLLLYTQFPTQFKEKQTKKNPALTFKSQVAEEGGQKVHDVHDKDGDVGHLLHFCLRWAEIRNLCYCQILQRCADQHRSPTRADSLAEFGVDGEDLRVTHEGKREDGNGVCRLQGTQTHVIHRATTGWFTMSSMRA